MPPMKVKRIRDRINLVNQKNLGAYDNFSDKVLSDGVQNGEMLNLTSPVTYMVQPNKHSVFEASFL